MNRKELRIFILKRDNFCCKLCSLKVEEKYFKIHHKDFRGYTRIGKEEVFKPNNKPENLETLCLPCHIKVHLKTKLNNKS